MWTSSRVALVFLGSAALMSADKSVPDELNGTSLTFRPSDLTDKGTDPVPLDLGQIQRAQNLQHP